MPAPTRPALRLFLTAWLVFALYFSTNVVREHYPAFSLAARGTFQVDEYQGLHPDIFVHTDGHSYIGNNVAASVFASVPLFLFDPALDAVEAYDRGRAANGDEYRTTYPNRQRFFKEVADRGLTLRFGAAAAVTSVFLIAPLSALCVVGVFRILRERGFGVPLAVGLALLFGFGTPLFFRSAHLSNNLFVMYFTFASYWLLRDRPGGNDAVLPVRRFLAGVCGGLALACDYSGAVPLVCLYGFLVLGRVPSVGVVRAVRDSVPFVLGSVPAVGFLLYSQWAMYGNPFFPGQYWMPDVNYTERGWRGFSGPTAEAFLLNLLHPSYGLVPYGPLLVLGLAVAVGVVGRRLVLSRPERLFTLVLTASLLAFCSANQYSLMQWNSGFRYLLPLVPFLFLAGCEVLVRLPRPVLIAVGVLAVGHGWVLCTARDCNPFTDTWRAAPDLGSFIDQAAGETVPASYLRVWNEGPNLPWLRVLQRTAPTAHPVLGQPWLPVAVLAGAALVVAGIWTAGRGSRPPSAGGPVAGRKDPTVAVVIPVLNEAHVLEKSVATVLGYLREDFPYPAKVVIADNGSTDGTGEIARRLAETYEDVEVVSLTVRGRGRALRASWTKTDADIFTYMDVDLSTELTKLEPLCRAIHEGGYGIATGSRLLPESRITRCLKRETLSQGYNLLVKWVLWTRFSDAQCGFKAVSRQVVDEVIPMIENQHWFFDTELLVLGEKLGYGVKDIAVRWDEDPDTRVKIVSTVWEDVKGVARLRWGFWTGRLRRMPLPVTAVVPTPATAAARVPAESVVR